MPYSWRESASETSDLVWAEAAPTYHTSLPCSILGHGSVLEAHIGVRVV